MIFLKGIRLNEKMDINRKVYPFNIPVLKNFKELEFNNPVTILVGENGLGKSTLIEAIAIAMGLNPEGGSSGFHFSTKASHSNLFEYIITIRGVNRNKDGFFLRAESFYNVITNMETLNDGFSPHIEMSYGGIPLHEVSHGEGFMRLLIHRCHGKSFFVFDEPEAALSPLSQIKMLIRINQLVKEDSQIIISTHSPILMAYPGATIYQLSENGIQKTNYEQTEHYLLMKYFLNNTDIYLNDLGLE